MFSPHTAHGSAKTLVHVRPFTSSLILSPSSRMPGGHTALATGGC